MKTTSFQNPFLKFFPQKQPPKVPTLFNPNSSQVWCPIPENWRRFWDLGFGPPAPNWTLRIDIPKR